MRAAAIVLVAATASARADTLVMSYRTAQSTSAFDTKHFNAVMATAHDKLLHCGHDAGLVTVKLTIGIDGKPLAVNVTAAADVASCMTPVLRGLVFARPDDGKRFSVTIPLDFYVHARGGIFGDADVHDPAGIEGLSLGSGSPLGAPAGARAPSSTLTFGQVVVAGDLDREVIRRFLKHNQHKLVDCYDKQLVKRPKLRGSVLAKFTIDAKGSVTASSAAGMNDGDVETCVAKTIQGIEFPAPRSRGAVTATAPLTFAPPDSH